MSTPRHDRLASGDHTRPLLSVDGLRIVGEVGGLERLLVAGVGFTVGPGETIAIVGESGSGKSLTALATLGLLPRGVQATGSVRFGERELLGLSERGLQGVRGKGISLLLQDPFTMLNPLRRCLSYVEETLARHGGPEVRARSLRRKEALRRLEEVGIDAKAAMRYPFEVSGGMAQRVSLAAALSGDPDLLIADEPTTALDVTTQHEVLALLKDLQLQRGMSLVLITHDLRVAFETCDRVFVFYAGSVLECGPSDAMATDPLHPYTLGLLASEPTPHGRREQLVGIPGSVPRPQSVRDICPFAPRCRWRKDECVREAPPLRSLGEQRSSACARIPAIQEELRAAFAESVLPVSEHRAPQRPAPAVVISDLGKVFTGRRKVEQEVLSGVTLRVGRGEAVGLVGESGSGKTTLARCIVGLELPTSGRIDVGGIDVSDYSRLSSTDRAAARRRVQMVFQNPYASLNPARTIGSTLREAARVTGADSNGVTARVQDLLEQVGLPVAYAGKRPAGLSGGERQRVAIARALAVEPSVLICDEPVSALDVSVQAQILKLLRELQQELGVALLFITHDLGVVRQVADYLYVISEGAFVEQGPTANVLDEPQHRYTRLLLASVLGDVGGSAVGDAHQPSRAGPSDRGERTGAGRAGGKAG